MNGATETGQAFDVYGRRIGIGRDRDGALYLDTGLDLYLFEPAERDKILEAIGRAAMPGQAAPAPGPGSHKCCEHCEHFGDENTDDHREPCPEGCNDGQAA